VVDDPVQSDASGALPGSGPAAPLGLQGTLFDDLPEDQRPGGSPRDVGYRGPTACNVAGITYRQLDYWARTGLVEPTVREASGSGTQRLYSFRDILVLRVVKNLLDAGVSLPNIRTAIATLRDRGVADLAEITLMSDGTTVYECTSTDEILDLLKRGQGVFGIAVGRHIGDVEGTLAALPGERATAAGADAGADAAGAAGPESAADELAHRRRRRTPA